MIVLKHPEDNPLLLSHQMTNNMCIFAVLVMTRCSSSATIILSEKKSKPSPEGSVSCIRTQCSLLEWNTVVSGQPKLIMLNSSCCPPAPPLFLYGNTFQCDHWPEPMRTGITRRGLSGSQASIYAAYSTILGHPAALLK